ncbi:hypothetical protein [Spirosoma fluviale]|uniref:hypothetical protein n=1 Tax=Spirosoma fluviale TaxID=1597977 RepID=UPI000BE2A664|nr:hypothetical protein [Spirosoma fluviale]
MKKLIAFSFVLLLVSCLPSRQASQTSYRKSNLLGGRGGEGGKGMAGAGSKGQDGKGGITGIKP